MLAPSAFAQPSDAQVRKDLKTAGVLSVKLWPKPGVKSWSSRDLQYHWERGATIFRSAKIPELPTVKAETEGLATYTIIGYRFSFKRFAVTGGRYIGMPNPNSKEVLSLLNADLPELLGYHYRKVVGKMEPVQIAAQPKYFWHTPNSVSLDVQTTFNSVTGGTQLTKTQQTFDVRLYRDAVKGKWKKFISISGPSKVLGKTTHDADEIKAMKSLAVIDAERTAGTLLSRLPNVTIPAFRRDVDFFDHIHKLMREGTAGEFEAFLRKTLSPDYFQENSSSLLTQQGEALVADSIKAAFKNKSTYADQYCENPKIKEYRAGNIQWFNCSKDVYTRVSIAAFDGTWENGVKVGQTFKIRDLNIYLLNKADDIARIKSMDQEAMCAANSSEMTLSALIAKAPAIVNIGDNIDAARKLAWTTQSFPDARLEINFPTPPKKTTGKMNDLYPMSTFTAVNRTLLCQAVSIVYPINLNKAQSKVGVESSAAVFAKSNNATITTQSEYSVGTFGKKFTMKKGTDTVEYRVFVIDDVLYQLTLIASPAAMDGISEDDFFGSFAALKP